MGAIKSSTILLRLGNQYLIQAASFLKTEIALSYGLDQAMMLAILEFDFYTTRQVHSLIEIDSKEYSTTTVERLIELTGIWDLEQAVNIISCLISSELITVISNFKSGKMIFCIN